MNSKHDQKTQSLKTLLQRWQVVVAGVNLPQPPIYTGPDVWLTHLTEKTSEVTPGACFVARVRAGSEGHIYSDGHPYIGKALDRGASMILAQRSPSEAEIELPPDVVYMQVTDTAVALAWLAAAWEDFPSRQLVTVGITGTDGKTSTASILFTVLQQAGLKVGLLSTIKAVIGGQEEPLELHVTTPEAPVVQRHLRRMVDAGLTHCILESTSHGLAQQRVGAVDFDAAVVTNITHEHLDYHGDYAGYFAAKARLFESLSQDAWQIPTHNPAKIELVKTAVLNRDDSSYVKLATIPAARQISYAIEQQADYWAGDLAFSAQTTRFTLHLPDAAPLSLQTPLVGAFNVYNMLAAAAAAHVLGVTPAALQTGLEVVEAISGRMERIDAGQSFLLLVDFAHTPNALAKVIAAARRLGNGRIITVFGSAGKRDVAKRRLMAEISARDADLTVLTAEDPRTEPLDTILAEMAAGCRESGGVEGVNFWRVADRGAAIYFALGLAQAADVILVCGKGHEQSMCFGVTEYPWDDREAARIVLDAFLNGRSMPDLGLPTFRST